MAGGVETVLGEKGSDAENEDKLEGLGAINGDDAMTVGDIVDGVNNGGGLASD